MTRPPRKAIPMRIKRAVAERQLGVCKCGCFGQVSHEPNSNTHFDHEPALRLRNVNRAGTDYIPPQHSVRHIDVCCPASHHAKTHGAGATTAGTDIGKIKKERRHARGGKTVRHPMRKGPKTVWPKRKMQSRNTFQKRAVNAGGDLARDELAANSGYSPGSGNFNNICGSLTSMDVLRRSGQGRVVISDWAREVLA